MKPLILTIALLFSTPAWADVSDGKNNVCKLNLRGLNATYQPNDKCDVLLITAYRSQNWQTLVSELCSYNHQIIVDIDDKFLGVHNKDVHISCVPVK